MRQSTALDTVTRVTSQSTCCRAIGHSGIADGNLRIVDPETKNSSQKT